MTRPPLFDVSGPILGRNTARTARQLGLLLWLISGVLLWDDYRRRA